MAEEMEEGGLTGSSSSGKPKAKPKKAGTSNVPALPSLPGATTPGANPADLGTGGLDWNAEVTTAAFDAAHIPVLDQSGEDPLGLATLIPQVGKGHPSQSIAARVASVSEMSKASQQSLAGVLNSAGILAPKSTAYTTAEIQTGLTAAFKEASQNKSPSLSDYLQVRTAQSTSGNAAAATGAVNELVASMQTTADAYGLPASAAGLSAQAQELLDSGMTVTQADATYKQDAQNQAAGLYPNFAPQIMAGQTTKTLLSPYASLAEKTIGVDPTTINWQTPLWAGALAGPVDKSTNRPSVASLSDFSKTLMQNPAFGYANTQEANNAAGSLVSSLLKLFGKLPNESLSTSMSGPTPDLSAT